MPNIERILSVFPYISLLVGMFGVIVIALGAFRIFAKVVLIELSKDSERKTTRARQAIRQQFSSYLLLGLELLIAADIIRTIIGPSLKEVAVLGSIVAIRIVISFFLNREQVINNEKTK